MGLSINYLSSSGLCASLGRSSVCDLIKLSPFFEFLYESHYCRAKNENKKYLPPNYTIKRFYEDYLTHCNLSNKIPCVTQEKFYDIIQYDTDISIHVPLQDKARFVRNVTN